MKPILIAACIALAGCNLTPPVSPGQIADRTTLDETAALSAELAYQATAELMLATGAAKRADVKAADARAYAALKAVRAAYEAGNAAGYSAALTSARAAVASLLTAVKG